MHGANATHIIEASTVKTTLKNILHLLQKFTFANSEVITIIVRLVELLRQQRTGKALGSMLENEVSERAL